MDRWRLRQVMYHIYSICFTSIKETLADTAQCQVNFEKTQRTSMKRTIKQLNSSQAKQTNKQDRCHLQSSRIFENGTCDENLSAFVERHRNTREGDLEWCDRERRKEREERKKTTRPSVFILAALDEGKTLSHRTLKQAWHERFRFQKFSYTVCRPVFDQWVFNKLVLKPSKPKDANDDCRARKGYS